MKYFIKLTIAVLISSSASLLVGATEDVAAEIDKQNEKYMAAYNTGDVDAVVKLHTNDARVMMSGQPLSVGIEAVRAAVAAETSGPAKLTLHLASTDVQTDGNTAYEKGRWRMLIQANEAEDITDKGPYLVIWKKVGEEWLIHFDAVFPGQAASQSTEQQ